MQHWIIFVLVLAPTSSMACNALIGLDAPSSAPSDAGDAANPRDGGEDAVASDGAMSHDSTSEDGTSCGLQGFVAPPRSGGGTAPTFSSVALVRDGVYALTAGPNLFGTPMQLFRGSTCDGALLPAHDATLRSVLATDSTSVYVATATDIERYPLDTTKGTTAELVETLVDPSSSFAMASNGNEIFYATAVAGSMRSAITRRSASDPMAATGVFWTSPGDFQINELAADANALYVTGSTGDLLSISLQTAQSHVLVPGIRTTVPFMVAGDYVYWITSDTTTFGTLRRARTSDGVAEDVVSPQVDLFTVIDDDVYVRKYGQILHMKIGSPTSEVVGDDVRDDAVGMVADATRVCWWSATLISMIPR